MFNLFKKIANYFTPLDEEAEVERAAAAAATNIVIDDEKPAKRYVSDKNLDDKPPKPSEPSKPDFIYVEEYPYPDLKKKRTAKSKLPGEAQFKVELEPTQVAQSSPTTRTSKTTRTTTQTTSKPELNGDQFRIYNPSNQQHKTRDKSKSTATATTASRRGRPPKTQHVSSNPHLGKRQSSTNENVENKKAKYTFKDETPTRRQRVRPTYEPHASRGRSKKLGDYQCLICADTFDDLHSRDKHAETAHPNSTSWRH